MIIFGHDWAQSLFVVMSIWKIHLIDEVYSFYWSLIFGFGCFFGLLWSWLLKLVDHLWRAAAVSIHILNRCWHRSSTSWSLWPRWFLGWPSLFILEALSKVAKIFSLLRNLGSLCCLPLFLLVIMILLICAVLCCVLHSQFRQILLIARRYLAILFLNFWLLLQLLLVIVIHDILFKVPWVHKCRLLMAFAPAILPTRWPRSAWRSTFAYIIAIILSPRSYFDQLLNIAFWIDIKNVAGVLLWTFHESRRRFLLLLLLIVNIPHDLVNLLQFLIIDVKLSSIKLFTCLMSFHSIECIVWGVLILWIFHL